jgi:14-3-3 protein epsilon
MNESEKEAILLEASLAEQCERHKDVFILRELLHCGIVLTQSQIVMLLQAYITCASEINTSRRILSSVIQRETKENGKLKFESVVYDFRKSLATELANICKDCVTDLDILLGQPNLPWEIVYQYNNHKVRFLTYLVDCLDDGEEKEKMFIEQQAAQNAHAEILARLDPIHPMRLSAILCKVSHLKLKGEAEKATELGQEAFDQALAKLDDVPEENYKEVTLQLSLLKDLLQEDK